VKRRLLYTLMALLCCLGSATAMAEPYFAVRMGLKCSACHVNPTGGGMRNTFGSVWGQTALPAKVLDMSSGGPWTGEVSRYLAVGANLRAEGAWLDMPGSKATSDFNVTTGRLYLDLRAIPDRLSIYFDERLAPGNANNAEAYLRLWSRDHRYYVKAGQMYLPFGIRLQDDSAFIREQTGISFATPDRGVEFGYDGTRWTAQLAVSNGTAGGPEIDNGKQWSLRSEYVQARWRMGASLNINDFDAGTRRMQNLFAGVRTGPVSWLAEADYIVDGTFPATRKQWAGLVEANWLVRQGHNLKFTVEQFDNNRAISSDTQTRMSLLYEYTPLPFVQLRLGFRNYDGLSFVAQQNQRIAFVQLHGYF
jgi:hypothetical protein